MKLWLGVPTLSLGMEPNFGSRLCIASPKVEGSISCMIHGIHDIKVVQESFVLFVFGSEIRVKHLS